MRSFLAIALWVLIVAICLIFVVTLGHGSSSCPTYREIKNLYPKDHHYWFSAGGRRCWTNRREVTTRSVDHDNRVVTKHLTDTARAEDKPEASPVVTSTQWMPRPFDAAEPVIKTPLEPSSYYATVLPDPDVSSEVFYSEDEYNSIDATLVATEKATPIKISVMSTATHVVAMSASLFTGLLLGGVVLLTSGWRPSVPRRWRKEPVVYPSIVEVLRRIPEEISHDFDRMVRR